MSITSGSINTDEQASAAAAIIRGDRTPAQKREDAYNAPPPRPDPEEEAKKAIWYALKEANESNTVRDLDYALEMIMNFKEKYYPSQSTKFRGKYSSQITSLEKRTMDKLEDMEISAPGNATEWESKYSNWRIESGEASAAAMSKPSSVDMTQWKGPFTSKNKNPGKKYYTRKSDGLPVWGDPTTGELTQEGIKRAEEAKAKKAAKKGGRRTRKKRGGGPEAAAADEAAPKIEWVIENTEGRINSFVNSDVPQRGDGFNNMIQQMRNRISDGGFWVVEWNEARDVHDDYNHYHLAWDDEDNEPPDLIRFPFPPLPTQAGGKKRKKRKKRKKKKSRKKRGGRKLNLFLSEINNRLRDVERRGEEREDEIRSNSAEIRDNDAAIIGNGDDITENAVDIGVIKSYINYKLNNTLENAAAPLDQWQGHLRSIDRRSHQEQPSLIDRQILTDANMRGGMKKTRKMKGGHHLYKRLGVSKYASQKTIKKAYNKIKKNKKITNKVKYAYKILSKKKTRKQYNNKYVKHKKLKRKKNKR